MGNATMSYVDYIRVMITVLEFGSGMSKPADCVKKYMETSDLQSIKIENIRNRLIPKCLSYILRGEYQVKFYVSNQC